MAGIAFGGFVPRAALHLVEAVRFTILGPDDLADADRMNFLERVEKFINSVDGWEPELEIFGSYVTRRREATTEPIQAVLVYASTSVADAAAIFGRYTTLLERLLAKVSTEHISDDPVEKVHDKLCNMLGDSYTHAVDAERPHLAAVADGVAAAPTTRSMDDLDNYLDNLEGLNEHNITVQECARVAQLLILAWTYQVSLINWDPSAPVHPLATHAEGGAAGAIELMGMDEIDDGPGALGL